MRKNIKNFSLALIFILSITAMSAQEQAQNTSKVLHIAKADFPKKM